MKRIMYNQLVGPVSIGFISLGLFLDFSFDGCWENQKQKAKNLNPAIYNTINVNELIDKLNRPNLIPLSRIDNKEMMDEWNNSSLLQIRGHTNNNRSIVDSNQALVNNNNIM